MMFEIIGITGVITILKIIGITAGMIFAVILLDKLSTNYEQIR